MARRWTVGPRKGSPKIALARAARPGGKVKEFGGRVSAAVLSFDPLGGDMGGLAVDLVCDRVNADPRALAERLPGGAQGKGACRTLESGRPARDFSLLLCSLSAEEQFALLPEYLDRCGTPARPAVGGQRDPLVIAGGMALRLNPRPILPFLDAFAPGDAEPVLPPLLDAVRQTSGRGERLDALAAIAGIGVPGRTVAPVRAVMFDGDRPAARHLRPGERHGVFMVETGRGCPAGCRFCAVGWAVRPPRFFSAGAIRQAAAEGIRQGLRIGLVGASLSQYPQLDRLLEELGEDRADLTAASLDPAFLCSESGRALLGRLAASGLQTLTLALECGSERLRRVIHKSARKEQILEAAARAGESGIGHLKLYLMLGLPTEEEEDLRAQVELVGDVMSAWLSSQRRRGRRGRLGISLNPFVPKPHTPFSHEAMPPLAELRRRIEAQRQRLRALGGIEVSGLSPRLAQMQCLLNRSDESMARVLLRAGGRWPPPPGLLVELLEDWEDRVHRPWPDDEPPPWRIVDTGVANAWLAAERERARRAEPGPPCRPGVCRACGACPERAETLSPGCG
jgi:radical SAM superfamily enzyme YgiQ (UPF0313 family)